MTEIYHPYERPGTNDESAERTFAIINGDGTPALVAAGFSSRRWFACSVLSGPGCNLTPEQARELARVLNTHADSYEARHHE